MRQEELVEALNASIPEVEVPIPGVTKPPGKLSFTSLKRLAKRAEESLQTRNEDLQDWVQSQNPESINKKNSAVTKKFKQLKKKVEREFNKIFPKETESALKGYFKNNNIKGQSGIDPKTFLDGIKPRVINFFAEQKKSIKNNQVLRIRLTRTKLATGQVEFAIKDFLTGMIEVHAGKFSSEQYESIKGNLLEQVANFQENCSGWQFDREESYDISVARFQLTNGSTYIDLPKELKGKKACVNVKNNDNKCYAAAIAVAILRRKKNAERYDDELKRFMKTLIWEGIELPANPWKASEKFKRNNPGHAINVYEYYEYEKDENQRLSILRVSDKMCESKNKIINLLLYSNDETNHYV